MTDKENRISHADDLDVMKALRELIVGPEQKKIETLETHLTEIEHPVATTEDIAKALPEAIRMRMREDESLQHALMPITEQAIHHSVINNPKPLSEALFPIMGPAIRKSINHTINSMLQSMNQALEHSFSIRGLRWRIQAMRSGKTFAEIVLLNTLVYRVEQVFVIHQESGLLIAHTATDSHMEEDADLVSSMLTAVRDFIHDSFATNSGEEIESLRMGELQLLVAQGPRITLALACRGNIPQDIYVLMDEHLEALQREYGREFADFDGDASPFSGIKGSLHELMLADYHIEEKRRRTPIRALMMIAVLLLPLMTWWGWMFYQQQQWHGFIHQLQHTPGIAILSEGREDGHFVVRGLRDPLAVDPLGVLPQYQLDADDVEMFWRPYYSLEETLINRRIISLLQPPESVQLALNDGMLSVRGSASSAWIEKLPIKASMIPGVLNTDVQLRNSDLETLLEKIQRLLAAPDSVKISYHSFQLVVAGEATQEWLDQARVVVSQQITELQDYDDTAVVIVDAPVYLLELAKQRLHAPDSIVMMVDEQRILHLRGQALQQWVLFAKQEAEKIPFLADSREQELVILDSPLFLLKQAHALLIPPATIKLDVSKDLELTARGVAHRDWILMARKQVKEIAYIQAYHDGNVVDVFDRSRVLRLARKVLNPPASVILDYQKGRLYAGGAAEETWIHQSRERASKIPGVIVYDDRQLFDLFQQWNEFRQGIRNIHLSFHAGGADLIGEEEQEKVMKVAALFLRLRALFPDAQLRVVGTSSLLGEKADDVALRRAHVASDLLAGQLVSMQQQILVVKVVRGEQWGVTFDVVR